MATFQMGAKRENARVSRFRRAPKIPRWSKQIRSLLRQRPPAMCSFGALNPKINQLVSDGYLSSSFRTELQVEEVVPYTSVDSKRPLAQRFATGVLRQFARRVQVRSPLRRLCRSHADFSPPTRIFSRTTFFLEHSCGYASTKKCRESVNAVSSV